MGIRTWVIAVAAVSMMGCLHGRGLHTVPTDRDYKDLPKVHADEAEPLVEEAHRKGAHHFAPYAYESAEQYLEWSWEARAEGDVKGFRDYANLSKTFAEEALANGSGIPDGGELAMTDNAEQARGEFERLKARYLELDACKAKVVAPHIYAHIETNLAQAEHEIIERCHYPEGIRHLRWVEADIDAIWAMDKDGDGVRDMDDGEPWIAEDADGFEDGDGMPEPKPYPVLKPVLFASDSATLSSHAQGYLNGIADMLIDGYSETTLYLSAHTDSDSSDEYNQELSAKREAAVKSYLMTQGVEGSRLMSEHHGEAKPVADNSSAAGKAQNRRVEIRLDGPDPVSPFCN